MLLRIFIITLLAGQCRYTAPGQSVITGFNCEYEVVGDNPSNSEEVLIKVRTTDTRRCGSNLNAVYNFKLVVNDSFLEGEPFYNIRAMFDSITPIENPDYSCLILPDPPCYNLFHLSERNDAVFEVPKVADDQLIFIADDFCCRDPDFTNVEVTTIHTRRLLVNFIVSGKALRVHNKSPVVVDEIPTIFCKGASTMIQQPTTDEEGDQVIFKFCAPFLGNDYLGEPGEDTCFQFLCPPFEEVSYNFPEYTPTRPLGLNSTLEMDPTTGEITVIPEQTGRFLVGICLEEYRNGELLSIMRREAQFYVVDCIPKVEARIPAPEMRGDTAVFSLCNETNITIPNESTDTNYITSFYWTFETTTGVDTLYEWEPTLNFAESRNYRGQLILEGADGCEDVANILIAVNKSLEADFTYSYDTCVAGAVRFLDLSLSDEIPITSWTWNFGNGLTANHDEPVYRFDAPGDYAVQLKVKDEIGCQDSLETIISWMPAPAILIVDPSSFAGCSPLEIMLTNLSTPIDTNYQTHWDFGDGNESTDISPQHIYTTPGTYTISLSVTSPLGCQIDTVYQNWIQVDTTVVAQFEYLPEVLDASTREIELFSQSSRAVNQSWLINGIVYSNDENPVYRIIDTGALNIQLFAWDQHECIDSTSQKLEKNSPASYFLPNAFTPNGDGQNDIFIGVGTIENIRSLQLQIFDRWGQLVFATTDPRIGWNGRHQNAGNPLSGGIYTYQGVVSFTNGESVYLKGNLVLIR